MTRPVITTPLLLYHTNLALMSVLSLRQLHLSYSSRASTLDPNFYVPKVVYLTFWLSDNNLTSHRISRTTAWRRAAGVRAHGKRF